MNDVTKWIGRIKFAERVRDDADAKYGYSRALKEYEGDFKSVIPSFVSNVDLVPINEVYAYAKAFVSSVYSRDPYLTVTPKGQKMIAWAKLAEAAINGYWRELRIKRVMRRVIYDAVFAEGWIKTGYSAALGSIDAKGDGPPIEPSEFVRSEEIFATRVSWRNMVKDPEAVDGIHDARWVAHQIIRPVEAVQASKLYEKASDIEANLVVSDDRKTPFSYEQGYVVLWEIWNRDAEEVLTIAEGNDTPLLKRDWPYKMEGYPFVLMRFNENPDEPYAPNLIGPWEPQLWEKMKLRAMALDHIKRFSRQLFAEKGAISKTERAKFERGLTAAIIEIEKGRQPPAPIQYPQIQPDMYAVENRIDLDKDNVSGQPNAVRSAPQRTQSRTLGEIDRLIAAFQARQSEPQMVVEDASAEVAYKIIKLVQQYFDVPRYVSITNKEIAKVVGGLKDAAGDPLSDGDGFMFSGKAIRQLEFQVDVRSGSTLPLDKANRVEAMVNILKLGPTIGITPGDEVSGVIGKNLLADFDMPEIEAAYEKALRRFEIQKIMAKAAQGMKLDMVERRADDLQRNIEAGGGDNGAL